MRFRGVLTGGFGILYTFVLCWVFIGSFCLLSWFVPFTERFCRLTYQVCFGYGLLLQLLVSGLLFFGFVWFFYIEWYVLRSQFFLIGKVHILKGAVLLLYVVLRHYLHSVCSLYRIWLLPLCSIKTY